LLLVAFLLVNAPNCHLSLVLASVVQGDAVNCNMWMLILKPQINGDLGKTPKDDNLLKTKNY